MHAARSSPRAPRGGSSRDTAGTSGYPVGSSSASVAFTNAGPGSPPVPAAPPAARGPSAPTRPSAAAGGGARPADTPTSAP